MFEPEILVGRRIEQYEIREHIDSGGMADVYLAYETILQRPVAFKIMLPALAADRQFVARFRREAQAVARLAHPNIVQVYAISQTEDGRPYIVMQYVEGGSLRDTLAGDSRDKKPMITDRALSITGKMADALRTAHRAGIVHRDIKPSNILLRSDGEPILVDLGIAAVEGGAQLTHTGALIGTPHYMSPEQASGKKVDGRADLYSLGVILYEMLAGRRPFEAADTMAVLHKQVYEQPPSLAEIRPDLPPNIVRLVHRCLLKDPDQRFQNATEMRDAIQAAMMGEDIVEATSDAGILFTVQETQYNITPLVTKTSATGSRKRSIFLALVALLVIAILFITWQFSLVFLSNGGKESAVSPQLPLATPSEIALALIQPSATEMLSPTPTDALPATATFAILPTLTSLPSATPAATPTATSTPDQSPQTETIGSSVSGLPIEAVRFGTGENVILFIGGLHAGTAPSTVSIAQRMILYFTDNPDLIPTAATVYVIANASPDSPYAPGELRGRLNANNVDLNRNWDCKWTQDASWRGSVVPGSGGPAPFSEPETRALRDFILDNDPAAVIFWEALARDGLSSAGACGGRPLVSQRAAEIYGIAAGYPVADFEELTNQELNGDGTNWIDQQGIPAFAVLLRDYENVDWDDNLAGVRAILQNYGS